MKACGRLLARPSDPCPVAKPAPCSEQGPRSAHIAALSFPSAALSCSPLPLPHKAKTSPNPAHQQERCLVDEQVLHLLP